MNLVNAFKSKNILKFGDFVLRSGIKTNYYCDVKEAFGDPKLLSLITSKLIKLVPENTTCVAATGYGGITLASLVTYKLKLPLVLVRDKVKSHGTKKSIDGYIPTRADKICIIDDVFTTGSSIRDTKEKLKPTKAKFTKAIVVLNRSGKQQVLSLLTDQEILS